MEQQALEEDRLSVAEKNPETRRLSATGDPEPACCTSSATASVNELLIDFLT
jgi:hypothetical protein